MDAVVFGFALTLIAGVATGVGGLAALFSSRANKKFLSACLAFSAGVMLYVSFAEILLEAFEALEYDFGEGTGYLIATVAFFAGILIMVIIDKFVPHSDEVTEINEDTPINTDNTSLSASDEKGLKRTGIMSAVAIGIHNFPEGVITFMATIYDPAMGVAIAIAIIIHNIPEGIATAAPIYYATGSKPKAFAISLSSGLVQPVGALFAWFLLQNVFENIEPIFGIAFAAVSGIMVFVAIHQLLPAAHKFGNRHSVMGWLFGGMIVMAFSLVVLEFVF